MDHNRNVFFSYNELANIINELAIFKGNKIISIPINSRKAEFNYDISPISNLQLGVRGRSFEMKEIE